MGKFSDSPFFLLKTFFDELNNTKPAERPILDYKWLVTFVSSFDNGDGTRTFTETLPCTAAGCYEPFTFDNTLPNQSDIIFTDYRVTEWNRREYYDPNLITTFNSYIVSPLINITARGGGLLDMFVKEENIGYQPIKVRYIDRDGNQFNFANPGIMKYEPGENIVDTLYKENHYMFTWWDTIVTDTFGLFENNRETYFRKDSLYHDWLKLMAHDFFLEDMGVDFEIRNYANTDKIFHYFHNIFKSDNNQKCRIIFDGMKDYVMRAVPEHQRTPNFTELCEVFFDRLYQEIYDLMKNIWSLIDPMEVDDKYLGYLSRYYDMFDVNVQNATLLQIREFIRDMIWMIKRKGTYTEFYILWRILTTTKNMLNVYERWHKRDVESFPEWPMAINSYDIDTWPNYPYYSDTNQTTNVPSSAWVDVMYVYRDEYEAPEVNFGAGPGWYKKWYPDSYGPSPSGENLMLSTHYILETDISYEPLTKTEIINKELWDEMVEYWEYVRPVNRVSNYRILIAPITDISGKYINLYEVSRRSSAYLKTKSYVTFDLEDDGYVHHQPTADPRNKWVIIHNLGKNILIQVFDSNFDEIVPKDIEYSNSTATLYFDSPQAGFAIIRAANWASTRPDPVLSETWNFYHLRQQKEIIVHYRNDDNRFYTKDTKLVNNSSAIAEFSDKDNNTAMAGTGNFVYIQSTSSQIWDIPHYSGMKGVIMSVYSFDYDDEFNTDNDRRVHPSEYTLITSNECKIEFNHPMSGYVVLRRVGDMSIEDLIQELEELIENVTFKLYSYDDEGERYEIDNGNVIKKYRDDNYYYFDISLDKEVTYVINEIDMFDKNGDLLFHSYMSNLYKPAGVDMIFHYRLEIPSI